MYNTVFNAAKDIADGKRSSSVITMNMSVSDFRSLHFQKIFFALLDDHPYEFYWYDKTGSTTGEIIGNSLSIFMPVIARYSRPKTRNTYELDTSVTRAAANAAARAKSIVNQAANMSLYNALDYFRQQICALVSYDNAALKGAYGDPWQLIYVFDGDSKTNVVCEGYAKAFKYLCDLWKEAHPSSPLECYLVEGTAWIGDHMWNVVRMDDGKNYLADMTMCDQGSNGRRFFLKGASDISKTTYGGASRTIGYTISGTGYTLTYQYSLGQGDHQNTLDLYTENEVSLNTVDYTPTAASQNNSGAGKNNNSATSGTGNTSANNSGTGNTEAKNSGTENTGKNNSGAASNVNNTSGTGSTNGTTASTGTASGTFSDVPDTAFYRDAVEWAVSNNITQGTGNGKFSPANPCTRGQMVEFLYRLANSQAAGGSASAVANANSASSATGAASTINSSTASTSETASNANTSNASTFGATSAFNNSAISAGKSASAVAGSAVSVTATAADGNLAFTDVPADAFYQNALIWAVNAKVAAGTSATTFSPNAPCTRGQMAVFLYQLKGRPAVSGASGFSDVSADAYYSSAVTWLKQSGITSGRTAAEFKPNDTCSRGEMVSFLYRYAHLQ